MGNCMKSGITKAEINGPQIYPTEAVLKIKDFNDKGKLSSVSTVQLQLTKPMLISSQSHSIWENQVWISTCVLPGVDPRGEVKKDCQDLCFVQRCGNAFLLTLYDGHGAHGHKIVEFCKSECLKQLESFTWSQSIEEDLVNLTHAVDSELKQYKLVDSKCSGTTQVMAYVLPEKIHHACVGDSRMILARNNPKGKGIQAVQLTEDQKPELPSEMERITSSGGRVQKLFDDHGKAVGPFRVWEQNGNSPGLAMSRSIGDSAGNHVGIISTPVTSTYDRNGQELFIVAASDGIWDVMSNQEVVSFVEKLRNASSRGITESPQDTISNNTTCIAHLLCEEARKRGSSL